MGGAGGQGSRARRWHGIGFMLEDFKTGRWVHYTVLYSSFQRFEFREYFLFHIIVPGLVGTSLKRGSLGAGKMLCARPVRFCPWYPGGPCRAGPSTTGAPTVKTKQKHVLISVSACTGRGPHLAVLGGAVRCQGSDPSASTACPQPLGLSLWFLLMCLM